MRKVKNIALDLLFPKQCLRCNKPDSYLCSPCQKNLSLLTLQTCPYCEKTITIDGEVCRSCRQYHKPININHLLVTSDYQDHLLAKTIHLFKYRFIKHLSQPLGKLMTKAFSKSNITIPDVIIPVPLHPYRLRWRGFNQSLLLAETISQELLPELQIPIKNNLIIRKKWTFPQKSIKKYDQRQKNMANIFKINKKIFSQKNNPFLIDKNILIVDDVATTGATIFNLAKEIKKLHPKSISAIILGRQQN